MVLLQAVPLLSVPDHCASCSHRTARQVLTSACYAGRAPGPHLTPNRPVLRRAAGTSRFHRRAPSVRHHLRALSDKPKVTAGELQAEADVLEQARRDLQSAIFDADRGVSKTNRDVILELVEKFEEFGAEQTTTGPELTEVWQLLWTTERETLFLLEKGIWKVGSAGESYQVIDVENGTLQNVIQFGEEGLFVVNSDLRPVSAQRCEFQFTKAALQTPGFRLPLPPFGQGWFETIYMDDKWRIAKDIRGDVLIVRRTGMDLKEIQNWITTGSPRALQRAQLSAEVQRRGAP